MGGGPSATDTENSGREFRALQRKLSIGISNFLVESTSKEDVRICSVTGLRDTPAS